MRSDLKIRAPRPLFSIVTESVQPSSPPPARLPRFVPVATSLSALVAHPESVGAAPASVSAQQKPSKVGVLARNAGRGAILAAVCVAGVAVHEAATHRLEPIVHHGSAGTKHTNQGNEIRWHTGKTEVLLDSSLDELGPTTRAAIQSAFLTWTNSDPKLPRVNFRRVEKTVFEAKPDGRNTVLVAPIKIAGHEHDLAVTLTYSDQKTGEIVEADVVINSEYPFRVLSDPTSQEQAAEDDDGEGSDGNGSVTNNQTISSARTSCTAQVRPKSCEGESYDVQNVATHEVGHFFGLGEDMTASGTTMYFCTNRCETHKRVLTDEDKTVMSSLYVAAEDPDAIDSGETGCGGARFSPRGDARDVSWGLFAPLFGLVAYRLRRASRSPR